MTLLTTTQAEKKTNMQLTHSNTRSAILDRISTRAVAITKDEYLREADLHDSTDINHREEGEIAFAKQLAAEWAQGKNIEAWHLKGVNEFIASAE
jgi:hypothetical protein